VAPTNRATFRIDAGPQTRAQRSKSLRWRRPNASTVPCCADRESAQLWVELAQKSNATAVASRLVKQRPNDFVNIAPGDQTLEAQPVDTVRQFEHSLDDDGL